MSKIKVKPIQVGEIAKTNKLVDARQVREAIRLCEELREAGVVPEKGTGYRLASPFASARPARRRAKKSR